jgi:hypothetical protein
MMRLISQMLMFPLTIAITSVDVFLKTLRAFQVNVGESIDALGESAQPWRTDVHDTSGIDKECACDNGNAQGRLVEAPVQVSGTIASYPITKEDSTMDDCNLGGDDLKWVSYTILFTKRDFEATLQHARTEVIDYSTDSASFGQLKIHDFLEKLTSQGVDFPVEWADKHLDATYDARPPGKPTKFHNIPKLDRKYITFELTLKRHLPKQEKDYDRQNAETLRGIKSGIDEVSRKLGP